MEPAEPAPKAVVLAASQRRQAIAQAVDELGRGPSPTIAAWFRSMRLPPPRVTKVAAASAAGLAPDRTRRLFDHWHGLSGGSDIPHYRRIDPVEIPSLLGYLAIVEVLDGGTNYRYRLYGADIVRHTGIEMTGRTTADLVDRAKVAPFIPMFFAALNTRTLYDRAPWYSEHQPPAHISQLYWHRLALPLVDDQGAVTRLLLSIVPSERADFHLRTGP